MSLLRSSYLDRFFAHNRRAPSVSKIPSLDSVDLAKHDDQSCVLRWMDADGSPAAQVGRIGCRAANGLALKCDTPLKPGTDVGIFGNVPGRAIVTYCRPDRGGYVLILVPVMRHRRRSEREAATGTAVLNWRSQDGIEQADTVEIRNLSTEGMQVATPHAVPVPSIVRVAGETVGCIGAACYCWSVGDIFLVGIQFVQAPYLKASPDYDDET